MAASTRLDLGQARQLASPADGPVPRRPRPLQQKGAVRPLGRRILVRLDRPIRLLRQLKLRADAETVEGAPARPVRLTAVGQSDAVEHRHSKRAEIAAARQAG